MKITGQKPQVAPVEKRRSDRPDVTPARGQSARTPAAEVRMSDAARALRGAREPESPDTAKVEALRARIEAGDFKVDPERIADAMMSEET